MRASTRIGIVVRQYAQARDLSMAILEINEKLTRIIRGRSIELVLQEEGLVTIVFDDYSTSLSLSSSKDEMDAAPRSGESGMT